MWREGVEQVSDALPCGLHGSFSGFAQEELEFGEDLFDRIEIRAVGWEEQEPGSYGPDGLAHGLTLVAAQIVHDYDVAGRERGYEELLHISGEELAVDRPIEHAGSIDPVVSQRRHEGQRLPLAKRGLGDQLGSTLRPASDRRHVGLGPGLVDEDQPPGIKPTLILLPLRPPPGDLRTILLAGEQAFF